ncbi:hypothetical protein SAMN05443287_11847 [Micromonospora phaseoli]|uniref:Uncharacterized protein n=1 Tax=Micromonospora phaseoli TaxID=1144548 RepID=A0A1H7E4F8_9ACTN|nr:hypothetical protein CLV64_1169 [Micromonospora phaseoli]GIJ80565.1 hypothetical protein Xph01_49970 [Micromonospora phaseoli]SEK05485.1 hypothetical protein SAMN05443287_11847 [Micromonospora phaseoli]
MCGSVDPLSLDSVMAETRKPATRARFPRMRTVEARLEAGFTGGPYRRPRAGPDRSRKAEAAL